MGPGTWHREQHALVVALVETLGALRSSRFVYVADTVERLVGRKGRTYEAWCLENAAVFR